MNGDTGRQAVRPGMTCPGARTRSVRGNKGFQYVVVRSSNFSRLHNVLKGAAVKAWKKERGWYFVIVDRKNCEQAYELVRSTPSVNKSAPYV